jgi:hypothetical protein
MGLFSENGFQNFRKCFSDNTFRKLLLGEMLFGISDNTFRKLLLRVMLKVAKLYG